MRHLAVALAILSSVPSIGFAQSPASPVVVAARALDPSTVPQSQPAPDAPEPAPLEIEPAPSEFATALAPFVTTAGSGCADLDE